MKKKDSAIKWMAGIILVFLFAFFVWNINLAKEPVTKFFAKEETLSEFTAEIREEYTSDKFSLKNLFININGLFSRITGQRVCNGTVLLNNGMLTMAEPKRDMQKQAAAIDELAKYVEGAGIPFLYVQAPYKQDLNGELLPDGVESYAIENLEELVGALEEQEISTLNLVPYLSATEELIENYYFKTDHHWNNTGAFLAFQKICERIASMFPEKELDLSYTQLEQWESHTLKNWFLGSRGKRVGAWFAGTDDFTWYTPLFETEMSCAIPKYRKLYSGDFVASNIRQDYLEEKDYFSDNTYVTYIGGDYPLVQHRNMKPVSDIKVLLLKDSYSLPVQAFLSTVFKEVDVLDPRHMKECTVAEYVARTEPDVVLLMLNPSTIGTSAYMNFGVKEAVKQGTCSETSVWQRDIVVKASATNNFNYAMVKVEYGKTYTVSFDDVSFVQGEEAAGVVTALYNRTAKQLMAIGVYDIEFCRQKQDFSWSFSTPDSGKDDLVLIFYAGMPGETMEKSVQYQNVLLYEWQ